MFGRLRQIRPAERRDTLVASATLFALMASHALLETARDALFLASIPATRLPFVYIGVAIAAVAVSAAQDRGPGGARPLSLWLAVSAVITLGFVPLLDRGLWVFYALYVWSAVVVTVGLARFFILLGARFTASQAKRVYAVVGAGSVAGAIAGAGVASVLAASMPAANLLAVAAAALLASALGPLCLSEGVTSTPAARAAVETSGARDEGWARHARAVFSAPYARRVAALLMLGTVVFTLVDFVFKSEVAARIEPADLGMFFARLYFALNVLSLAFQLFIVRPAVRSLGPPAALAVLPALLCLGGLGVMAGAGVVAALVLKGADGALRHSLHRTASELLFVPMTGRLRTASKTFIDIAGHRGAQALTSVALLAATAFGVSNVALGAVIAALAGVGVALSLELRRHYLDVFRATLANAAERTRVEFPELTLGTLESLIAALNSSDEQRVKVALRLFAEQGRAHLIPGLILYHPSPEVLREALDLLATTNRTDFLPLADRLIDHEYAEVRAAALRARVAVAPDEALLRRKAEVDCPVVRATALVGLTAGGYASIEETGPQLDDVLNNGSDIAKEALARAIGYAPEPPLWGHLDRLAGSRNPTVLASVVRSMAKVPQPMFTTTLVSLLPHRSLRADIRTTLVQIGDPALEALETTLADDKGPRDVRRQVPAAVARFGTVRAAEVLVRQLADTDDAALHYKTLRALNRIVSENPGVRVDRAAVDRALGETIARAYGHIDNRLALEAGRRASAARATVALELLIRMLRDKEVNAIERVFRLLGVLAPSQDVQVIFRGLSISDPEVQASSRELLESFVRPRFRGAVLGLVDDVSDAERLRAAGSHYAPQGRDYDAVLGALADGASASLATLATYHLRELGGTARPPVDSPAEQSDAPGHSTPMAPHRLDLKAGGAA